MLAKTTDNNISESVWFDVAPASLWTLLCNACAKTTDHISESVWFDVAPMSLWTLLCNGLTPALNGIKYILCHFFSIFIDIESIFCFVILIFTYFFNIL